MTEESLIALDINDLLDVMVKSVTGLLGIGKIPQNKLAIKSKQKEVELIQKVILARRAELSHG